MSAGAVFKLIANDGKADKMLMATELLNARLRDIMCARRAQGYSDPTPTLVDIERTHILFVNAHFKPFAAHGYEYNESRTTNGAANFGGEMQFSIPQFGDFFSDMVIYSRLGATSATTGTVPVLPTSAVDGAVYDSDLSTATASVSVIENTPANTFTKYTIEYVDSTGNVLTPGAAASNFVRYAEFVGERLFKKIKFEVNGNPLDEYDSTALVFHRKFRICIDKLRGWKKLVGQEVEVSGYSDLSSIAGVSSYPSIHSDASIGGVPLVAAPSDSLITARKLVSVVSGPQTPKATQPELTLWTPLIFWFNTDSRLSIPSVAIPFGQRYIIASLEEQNKLLFVAPGNLYQRLTTEIRVNNTGASAPGTNESTAVLSRKVYTTLTPILATGSSIDTAQTISQMKLYINNIFVNPEVHDLYIKRIGFSLIRVHRQQREVVTSSAGQFRLTNLKYPIEYMYVGARPTVNTSNSNVNQYRDWHNFTSISDNVLEVNAKSDVAINTDSTAAWTAVATTKFNTSQVTVDRVVVPEYTQVIDKIALEAHGISIYNSFDSKFFNAYQPYVYGGTNMITPEDNGAHMINFCLYPGSYQPSGHFNISRAREFEFKYETSFASSSNPIVIEVDASALNFLLISDGTAVLRYST